MKSSPFLIRGALLLSLASSVPAFATQCFQTIGTDFNLCFGIDGTPLGVSYTDGDQSQYIDYTENSVTSCPNPGTVSCIDTTGLLLGYSYNDALGLPQYVDATGGSATGCPYSETPCLDSYGNSTGVTFSGGGYFDFSGSGATSCPSP